MMTCVLSYLRTVKRKFQYYYFTKGDRASKQASDWADVKTALSTLKTNLNTAIDDIAAAITSKQAAIGAAKASVSSLERSIATNQAAIAALAK